MNKCIMLAIIKIRHELMHNVGSCHDKNKSNCIKLAIAQET